MSSQTLSYIPTNIIGRVRNTSGGSTSSLESDLSRSWSSSYTGNSYEYAKLQSGNPLLQYSILDISDNKNIGINNHNNSQSMVLPASAMQPNNNNPSNKQQQQQQVLNPGRYKTEMCRPFAETGHCKYGDKCQFAHGPHEMRGLPRHPKYKTEPCRTFHTVGFCPYGPRCHFIHSEDEGKLYEIGKMKQQQASHQASKDMAQIQVLQSQLSILMSQMQTQISNQLSTTSPTVYPQQIPIGHSSVKGASGAYSLGSTGDSPPDSPVGSLTDDVFHQSSSPPVVVQLPSPTCGSVVSQNTNNNVNTVTSLMGGLVLEHSSKSAAEELSPPSSPESLESCGNSQRSAAAARLPVFSQLAAKRMC